MEISLFAIVVATVVLAFLIYALIVRLDNECRSPLPPGPQGLPLVGNWYYLPGPGEHEGLHWLKHKALYGPMSSVTVMGQTIVIVNDFVTASEILNKRAAKHSTRIRFPFAGEMVGWDKSLPLLPYGQRFRSYRKNMSNIMGSQSTPAHFNSLQTEEVAHFLLRVLDDPLNFLDHIKKEAGFFILQLAYGYTAEPYRADPLMDGAADAILKLGHAVLPGEFLVDLMPFNWFPGTKFKETAREWGAQLYEITERPYTYVKA